MHGKLGVGVPLGGCIYGLKKRFNEPFPPPLTLQLGAFLGVLPEEIGGRWKCEGGLSLTPLMFPAVRGRKEEEKKKPRASVNQEKARGEIETGQPAKAGIRGGRGEVVS